MTVSMVIARRVYIVDDDAAVRRSLSRLLNSAGFDVETFASPSAFLEVAMDLPNEGCLLIDVRMPGMDGLELQARVVQLGVALPILIMTGQADVHTAVRAMKLGAFDFLEKPLDDKQLIGSIEAALEPHPLQDRNHQALAAARRIAVLSPRERQVLDGLVGGHQNKVIAAHLGLSVRTVEGHRIRMLERLGTHRLAEAIRLAVMASLVRPDDKPDR
jgi:two-component system, LuxR family, response regulator FixJ